MPDQSPDTFRELAEVELDRHKAEFEYADVQLYKAGDFQELAKRIRKRHYVSLLMFGMFAVLHLFTAGSFGLLVWGPMLAYGIYSYANAKRTQEAVHRLEKRFSSRDQSEGPA